MTTIPIRSNAFVFALLAASLACGQATSTPTSSSPSPSSPPPTPVQTPGEGIRIGTEYILIENPSRVSRLADMLAPVGLATAKPLGEHIEWGKMQISAEAPIAFDQLDAFVQEFQAAGFSDLILALKSRSPWASQSYGVLGGSNDAPRPEFLPAYEAWIAAVVERYDGDGSQDAPGLLYPIRFYEIGSEFSSYEPEPVEVYLAMLERAYVAAHGAYPDVLVAHAAFLTTLAFAEDPLPSEYDAAFESVPDQTHTLADIRQVLDRPDIFDILNVHTLGDPTEIEAIVDWLDFETGQRGYQKRLIISDTATTPFVAWGAATACDRNPSAMGRVIPPATEGDRCRLAEYFNRLMSGDDEVLRWVQQFSAEDMVKKVVIAAEQGVLLINTAFTEDLIWLKLPIAQAGAGNSAWAGLVDLERGELRAGFYALQQLIDHMDGYEALARVPTEDQGIRLYTLSRGGLRSWIAWYDPGTLLLPGDPEPAVSFQLDVGTSPVVAEAVLTSFGQSGPFQSVLVADDGIASLTLGTTPIFLLPGETPGP